MARAEPPDHEVFFRLYVAAEPSLRGFVRSLVPTVDDMQEVMQEVAMVLWRKFDTLSAPEDFRRWSFGVAKLEVLEYLRKRMRDRHVFGEELLLKLADDVEDGAERFAAGQRALDHCLQKLPEEQRSFVESAYAPGARIDELAERLGRTAMSVYKALHRIRIVLTECVGRRLAEEGWK
jgi:RNA polymerase sigma-70 factor (ECF subfamily)